MYRKELAHTERYFKLNDALEVDTSLTVYEVYVEKGYDKEGNVLKNKDGSDRYFPIDDAAIEKLAAEVKVKKIRDDLYKPLFEIDGDLVERVERDGKRVYYVVDASRVVTLPAGTKCVRSKSGYIKPATTLGYVLIDDTEEGKDKVLSVRPYTTDDPKKEAEDLLKASSYRHHRA